MLARAGIAGFAVTVIALALVARTSGDGSPSRLPALGLGGVSATESKATTAVGAPFVAAGEIEYRVRGALPDLPRRARAWTLGRDGDGAGVATLARVLGLDGPVKAGSHEWTVTAGGRTLRVERQPGLPWYFGPEGGDVVPCTIPPTTPGAPPALADTPVAGGRCGSTGRVAAGSIGSAGASSTTATTAVTTGKTAVGCPPPCPPGSACPAICDAPGPVPTAVRPVDFPTREQAEAAARALLAKAGVEIHGARVRLEDAFSQWWVEVEPQVGGLPTLGFTSSVSVGPKGAIEAANGWLAEPSESDEYPLVTASAGLERLKRSPFGIGPQPLIARAPSCVGCEPPQPVVRTVTGVRVGLAFAPLVEPGDPGRALLVPVLL